MHHGVKFSLGSARVCSPTIFETCFSYDKDIWIAATNYYVLILYLLCTYYLCIIVHITYVLCTYYVLLPNCAISIDIYSPVNKFYSVIIFSLLINAVIFLLNCLVLILHLYMFYLLDIIFTT